MFQNIQLVKDLKKHWFLFEELVKRDFNKKYKRTFLGVGWSLLSPLLSLLVMSLVFTRFFGRETEHYTIYLFCGTLVMGYFRRSSTGGMHALMGNAGIFTKINVPKYLFLLSKNVQTLINFLLSLVVFFVFCLIEGIPFTARMLMLIYPITLLLVFNIGVGLILSAMYVFFRDIEYLWTVAQRLISYTSAIFYTMDRFSASEQQLFYFNPVYCFIRYFRWIVLDMQVPPLWFHGILLGHTLLFLGIGCLIYKKYNNKFIYYI